MLSPARPSCPSCPPCSFARNVDVETSPDADTPRPCGVALLVSELPLLSAPALQIPRVHAQGMSGLACHWLGFTVVVC